jgi:Predicted nucleic acid-binding protein, contains PIN domain
VIILDTNVVSAVMQERPPEVVVGWLDRQPRTSVWTTAVSVLEIRLRLEIMADGRRKASLIRAFERLIAETLERRIASFDTSAAQETAILMGFRQLRGQARDLRDSMIASIALARHATLATRNVKHFADLGLEIVDPWEADPSAIGRRARSDREPEHADLYRSASRRECWRNRQASYG